MSDDTLWQIAPYYLACELELVDDDTEWIEVKAPPYIRDPAQVVEQWWEGRDHTDGYDVSALIRRADDPDRIWHVDIEAEFRPHYHSTATEVTP